MLNSKTIQGLIIKYIEFKYCYYLLLLNIVVFVVGFFLGAIKNDPNDYIQLSGLIVSYLITMYIFLGFIKYSYVTNQDGFRKIIFVVLCLEIYNLLTLFFLDPFNPNSPTKLSALTIIPKSFESILWYYAFKLIQNEESIYFNKLSMLNLYFFFISIIFLLMIIFSTSFPFIVLSILMLAVFAVFILLWYWEIKLFKHLSLKMV